MKNGTRHIVLSFNFTGVDLEIVKEMAGSPVLLVRKKGEVNKHGRISAENYIALKCQTIKECQIAMESIKKSCLNIVLSDIEVDYTYKYVNQCNLSFSIEDIDYLGEINAILNITCYE